MISWQRPIIEGQNDVYDRVKWAYDNWTYLKLMQRFHNVFTRGTFIVEVYQPSQIKNRKRSDPKIYLEGY